MLRGRADDAIAAVYAYAGGVWAIELLLHLYIVIAYYVCTGMLYGSTDVLR